MTRYQTKKLNQFCRLSYVYRKSREICINVSFQSNALPTELPRQMVREIIFPSKSEEKCITILRYKQILAFSNRAYRFQKAQKRQRDLTSKPLACLSRNVTALRQGRQDLNPQPSVLETDALPVELHPYVKKTAK